jgi:hypothetical protein
MLRLEAADEKKPPASEVDVPNMDELRTPTGADKFTLLKMFLPMAAKLIE